MRDGFRLFGRHPLPFSLLFVVFLAAAVLASALPLFGGFLMLGAVPLLSLGFMVSTEAALHGKPVHPGQFVTPLTADPGRRRSLLLLCATFGALTLASLVWAEHADGGTFVKLQRLLAEEAAAAEIQAVIDDPQFFQGLWVRALSTTLLSAAFWHAPALVHWGGQGPAQALFSSALALWRTKAALLVYLLAWCGIVALFGLISAGVFRLLGLRQLVGLVALPAGLIFSTIFYVSLYFVFADSFGEHPEDTPAP